MKKILLTTTLLALPVMAAAAGPEHFRVWGCDPDTMTPVYGKDGETVLYYWGGDCPSVGGSSAPDLSALTPVTPVTPVDPGDDDDDGEDPGDDNGDDTSDDTNGDNTDDTSDENDDEEIGPIGIGW